MVPLTSFYLARRGCHYGVSIVHFAQPSPGVLLQELDSPGHTTAISSGYPEHIACANKSPWATYASEPPAGQLRIASDATIEFAKTLFDSISNRLPGTMTSSGGDEVNLPCWEEDEETQVDLAQKNVSIEQALDSFIGEVQGVLKKNRKVPFIKSGRLESHFERYYLNLATHRHGVDPQRHGHQ